MPYVVPVDLYKQVKALFWYVVLDVLGIGLTGGAFEQGNRVWFIRFLIATIVLFLITAGQLVFIYKVAKDL